MDFMFASFAGERSHEDFKGQDWNIVRVPYKF